MRRKLVCLPLFALTACTPIRYVEMHPQKVDGQEVIFDDGREILISQKKHFVALTPYKALSTGSASNTSYIVLVRNLGEGAITVGSENITVSMTSSSPKWNGQTLKVISYNELVMEVDKAEAAERRTEAWGALGRALSASSAAYTTSTTHNSGRINGHYQGKRSFFDVLPRPAIPL